MILHTSRQPWPTVILSCAPTTATYSCIWAVPPSWRCTRGPPAECPWSGRRAGRPSASSCFLFPSTSYFWARPRTSKSSPPCSKLSPLVCGTRAHYMRWFCSVMVSCPDVIQGLCILRFVLGCPFAIASLCFCCWAAWMRCFCWRLRACWTIFSPPLAPSQCWVHFKYRTGPTRLY